MPSLFRRGRALDPARVNYLRVTKRHIAHEFPWGDPLASQWTVL